jgi:bifunctional non-homologous end joining protein LigD
MKKNSILSILPTSLIHKCKKKPQPTFMPLMLATLTKNYFSRPDWIYEHKFDGERCLVVKKKGVVHLLSRNRRLINNEYPELAAALKKQKADNFIIDGEIVAKNEKGVSDFQLLQSRINLGNPYEIETKTKQVPIHYCIFDCLYVEGHDICDLPLLIRKKILKKLLRYNSILSFTEHKTGNGLQYFKYACKHKWEGLIAKKADSVYVGVRSPNWLKFKCSIGQELVIGGYTSPRNTRTDFGALLVGYYQNGKLQYAGKVGTGFSQDTLHMLGKTMRAIETDTCPFDQYDGSKTNVHWLKPKLVAEFEFAQWTQGGKLRVGRYKGLRTDKKATNVVKEIPKM